MKTKDLKSFRMIEFWKNRGRGGVMVNHGPNEGPCPEELIV